MSQYYITKRTVLILAFCILFNKQVSAQKKDSLKTFPLVVWGYADIYYTYDFNESANHIRNEMVQGNTHVYSHNQHNQFALNHGIIGLNYQKQRVRGAFAYQTGTYVQANYAAEPTLLRGIYEAYVGYQIHPKLWIDAGVFGSHIGAESVISADNLTLSRSVMADNTPYYETGIKLSYTPTAELTLTALVLNGWQNIEDHNSNKALGIQIQYKPHTNIIVNYSTFYGKEAAAFEPTSGMVPNDSVSTQRFFNNFYTQCSLSKKLTLLAAFDIGIQQKRAESGNDLWYNPNLIFTYAISKTFTIAVRAEYYHDKNGIIIYPGTANGFQTFAPSLGLDIKLSDELIFRMEGRTFHSKDAVYLRHGAPSHTDGFFMTSLSLKLKS